jgi:endonuclease/exonuclease/phosphatase family metal-dependent hydrolase
MDHIGVMTLNIWKDEGPWAQRSALIADQIRKFSPDLIAFQEVLRGDGTDLLADILEGTEYHSAFGKALDTGEGGRKEYGNAIASRWQIEEQEVIKLPVLDKVEDRVLLICRVRSPIGGIWFSSTHLTWELENGHIREHQVRAISDHILSRTAPEDFPPLIAGDFNAVPNSTEIRFMRGLHALDGVSVYFRDIWEFGGGEGPGLTWSRRNPYIPRWLAPDRRIDYIFVGPPKRDGVGEILNCQVVCDMPRDGVWPSDHFGVYAQIATVPAY